MHLICGSPLHLAEVSLRIDGRIILDLHTRVGKVRKIGRIEGDQIVSRHFRRAIAAKEPSAKVKQDLAVPTVCGDDDGRHKVVKSVTANLGKRNL